MSKKATKPEEKGFFDKVKDTIGGIWDGTKDKAEDLKHTAEDTFENLKEKVTPEKPKAIKIPAVKKAVDQKAAATVAKAKLITAKTKGKAEGKVNDETKKAKGEVANVKAKPVIKPKTTLVKKGKSK